MYKNHILQGTNIEICYINEQLPEKKILYIQEKFMTPGFHYFYADCIKNAILIFAKILKSLNYYNNVACITNATIELEIPVTNLKKIFFDDRENIYNF